MRSGASFGVRPTFVIICLLCLVLIQASVCAAAENKIVLKKYPELKFGLLTASFAKALPPTVPNIKKIIDFAAEQGFAFIEIRDNAKLTVDDCKQLAAYAKQKGVGVIYAMNIGLLDKDYFTLFEKGLANAAVLDGPKFIRTGANGDEMTVDEKKTYWTAAEFEQMVKNANRAAEMAKSKGLKLLVENAREGLNGDGRQTFGSIQLFGPKGMGKEVGLQLDTANFFCTSRVPSTPEAAKKFFDKNAARVGYTHLKTSKGNKPQPVLDGNQLGFDVFFKALAKKEGKWIAFELDPAPTADAAFANHVKSVEYLKKNF